MMKEKMLDASELDGFRRLTKIGWRVSVSERLWERYVQVPELAHPDCETERHRKLAACLLSSLRDVARSGSGLFTGYGFRMQAYLHDAQKLEGDIPLATVEVGVFPTFDRRRLPHLLVFLVKETMPEVPERTSTRH